MRLASLLPVALAAVALCSSLGASAGPPAPRVRAALSPGVALSVGAPNNGRLVAGDRLEPSALIRVIPSFSNADYRWGLPALVQLIERAASHVAEKHPGAILSVGDLSRRSGGGIREHLSHQSGRDADIGFYVCDASGDPVLLPKFVEFDRDGLSREAPDVRFDDARNWALVEALVSDRNARVEFIFVSSQLRTRLIREASRQRAPLAARMKAARVMREPGSSTPHADHFHVRIACPSGQRGACEPYARAASRSASRQSTRRH